jgi:hypothetical protein
MKNATEKRRFYFLFLLVNQTLITVTDKRFRGRYLEIWVTSLVNDHDRYFASESNDRNPFPRNVTACTYATVVILNVYIPFNNTWFI